ncbi:hypothetical protein NL676_027848 [Syzygium grande]|nr:hypothetical protein NL676_027848 [Syzygium grande]
MSIVLGSYELLVRLTSFVREVALPAHPKVAATWPRLLKPPLNEGDTKVPPSLHSSLLLHAVTLHAHTYAHTKERVIPQWKQKMKMEVERLRLAAATQRAMGSARMVRFPPVRGSIKKKIFALLYRHLKLGSKFALRYLLESCHHNRR